MLVCIAITRNESLKQIHSLIQRRGEKIMNEMKITFKSPDEILEFVNTVSKYEFDMDMKKGRPIKVDEEEVRRYGYGDPLAMDYASRKIALPKETKAGTPFPVRRYHIDTNEHVNNCQYVQMAQEILPDPEGIFKMRAEYKKSAVYGDMIYPEYAKEEDREVAFLCDEAGKPYALVEFKRR